MYFPKALKTTSSNMRSTYVLIEQSELHNFLRELDVVHSWAKKMAGLSTLITSPAPLGMPAARSGPRYHAYERPRRPDPFAASAWNTPSEDEYYTTAPAPRPQQFQHNHHLNQHFGGMGQGYGGFEYREPAPMGYTRPPPRDEGRQGVGLMGMCRDQPGCEARARDVWPVPIRNGPHRTPVITRAPNNPYTPQRGAMFVSRPRRARPQGNAGNAEAMDDETEYREGEEYVEEAGDQVVGDEREAR
ncbi:hypothetical protein BKA58DRAFT_6347 [Alternaria rosae]|uniref:uncharacterized protein n=1 Tax=Alternaria rosae TaxID=1187941 RepID=UPI001E8E59CC|nr:uncharacterized protein BKA58DRAFT_6347 [Alternaria rosae]KAH6881669.1 hypothetical protein BKA58DRAFT_6347 [Alternaria rosae]